MWRRSCSDQFAAERGVRPVEHRPAGVVGEGAARAAPRPPQRLVATDRHVGEDLGLVEAEPDEGIGRGRHLLEDASSLADDGDELASRIGIADGRTEQLRGANARGDVEGDERPVAVRGEPGEELVERLVGDPPRRGSVSFGR